jgi:rubrerythrin
MRVERSDWEKDEANLNRQLGLLAAAIRIETFGRDFYQRMNECTKDREGKLILKSLSRD